MNQLQIEDITVVILAGGKGRRMGGQDKGLVNYKNSSLVKHVIDAISLQSDKIIINANRNLDEYSAFGYPVVEDTLHDFQGPLAGFLAAMSNVSTDYILTMPCDGPVIIDDYVNKMKQGLNESTAVLAIASDGTRMQPVYALIPLKLADSLQQFLLTGERKIDLWYQQQDFTLVEFEAESEFFTNINTPQDLKKYS
ncbi:MAG: molybdenum cofactor guanylyltransferase [Gammaproteobacteria bacterium]|jgi:molybdopterin-guanine dinucleotide biosynthesis protein A|nr:molybdenum cofactor guanylyltransferase [Gammaproteobacteria bacterium]